MLLASIQEWPVDALRSALERGGYITRVAATGTEALHQAHTTPPDAILVGARLPDGGVELCQALRRTSAVAPSTPILLIITSGYPAREDRVAGLQAGAWDVIALPLDTEELIAKLAVYLAAKRDADRARDESLLDPILGLYSRRGLERRAHELAADAQRRRAPLGCVVLAAEPAPTESARERDVLADVAPHVTRVLQAHGRASDPLGRWNSAEFAVLAPASDTDATAQLAARLATTIEGTPLTPGAALRSLVVHAGYDAAGGLPALPVQADELLAHASAALDVARRTSGARIRRFERERRC